MLKKILSAVTALLIVAGVGTLYTGIQYNSTLTAYADTDFEGNECTEGTYGDLTYWKYNDHVVIWDCDESAEGEIIIPDEIEGLPVTSIRERAFFECSVLKSITIPDTITSISSQMFAYCTNLESITISDSVISIESLAFQSCTSLTSIILPNGVVSIGESAFAGCTSLAEITIPESVTEISGSVFSDTKWLENKRAENPLVIVNNILVDGTTCKGDVVIPDGVTSIAYGAFVNCTNLTGVIIPDSVVSIGFAAFADCTSLTEITIPESVTKIETFAFSGTKWLENKRAENPLVIVNNNLIEGNYCVGKVIIPDGIKEIPYQAFYGCTDLTEIIIPDTVTSIGMLAFGGCTSLTEIVMPNSVTSVEDQIFADCSSLTNVTLSESLTNISSYMFSSCESLKSITIPESVTSIGLMAFVYCNSLESVTIMNPNCKFVRSDFFMQDFIFANSYEVNDSMQDYYKYYGEIQGWSNSTAQIYAEEYGYKFESLGEYSETPQLEMGDVDGDGKVDSADATLVLTEYALLQTGADGAFTSEQFAVADVDKDGKIDSVDASKILSYYADISTGKTPSWD